MDFHVRIPTIKNKNFIKLSKDKIFYYHRLKLKYKINKFNIN